MCYCYYIPMTGDGLHLVDLPTKVRIKNNKRKKNSAFSLSIVRNRSEDKLLASQGAHGI